MNSELTNNLIFYFIFLILLSFSISSVSIPFIKQFGIKFNILDNINLRNFDDNSIVRIGGLGIFIGYSIALIFILNITLLDSYYLFPLLLGSFLMFLLGITDDLFQLSPYLRLVLQILIASYVISSGIAIENIDLSFFGAENFIINLPNIFSFLITIFWIVGITNAINWIDGLDGLASGITAISTLGIAFISLRFGNTESAFCAFALLGANLGFLKYNFKPAKIYMGDGGSYLIGFALASLSITSNLDSYKVLQPHLPIIILLLPILDMSIVIFKRLISGKSPFFPDQNHIHHRLLAIGFSELKVVYLLYLFNLSCIFLALFITFKN